MKYPPCKVNIWTEKPFTRHAWAITGQRQKLKGEDVITYYRVSCKRCGLRDPNEPTF